MILPGCAKSGLQFSHRGPDESSSQSWMCICPKLVDCWIFGPANTFEPAQRLSFAVVILQIIYVNLSAVNARAIAQRSSKGQHKLIAYSKEAKAWQQKVFRFCCILEGHTRQFFCALDQGSIWAVAAMQASWRSLISHMRQER